jgi:hypothetical protein
MHGNATYLQGMVTQGTRIEKDRWCEEKKDSLVKSRVDHVPGFLGPSRHYTSQTKVSEFLWKLVQAN